MEQIENQNQKPKIYVIHENDLWMEPLRDAFKEQGLEFEEWHLGEGGSFDLSVPPPEGIYYNRMSASSHTRGHRYAIEHTHAVLEWLELYGRRVVNNSKALLFEQSKIRQYVALERYGIKTPRTVPVTGNYDSDFQTATSRLLKAARDSFGDQPFISKHNRSGKGLGVRLWNNVSFFESYLHTEFQNEIPVDGIVLLQQYIKAPQNHIVRCEFVDSKFLYAVQVNTSEGFELCPADNCSIIQNFKTNFEILKDFNDPIIQKYEKFIRASGIEVTGIEFIKDEEGNLYTYDVNTNTNYNSSAERRAFGMPVAMPTIARFLGNELQQLKKAKGIMEAVENFIPIPSSSELKKSSNWMDFFFSALRRDSTIPVVCS